MATPTPGEPYAESVGEAIQSSVMAMRLVVTIADAVRRQQQRRRGKEEELPPAEKAMAAVGDGVKKALPSDIVAALMEGADWPQMAQQMLALQNAGVDLSAMLPRIGEIAVNVRDQVTANTERVAREGTGEWERLLREVLPAGPVREAMLSSPKWPDMAADMARQSDLGVDVRQLLVAAHDEGLGVDQAMAKVLGASPIPTTSRDAMVNWGPLTTGLDVPSNLNLSDREGALRQLAVFEANPRYVRLVTEAMTGRPHEAGLLVASVQWPLIAARMAQLEKDEKPVREHLARLLKDTSWEEGETHQLGARLVQAASDALVRPVGDAPAASRVRVVNTAAARATSTTVGPTRPQAANGATPAEPGVAAHRQTGAPARKNGKTT